MATQVVDWNTIKQTVQKNSKSTGMVANIESGLRELLKDGEPATVAQLQGWLEVGLNEGRDEDDQVQVNWITVKYTLTHKGGFREVEHNVFQADPSVKRVQGKKGRKQ